MNDLMQDHNSLCHPQSSIRQQRPSHNPPKNLSQNEIQCLYDLLGNNCVTLATAVAQILHGYNNIWRKLACGVLCFIKDFNKRVYCFRLYDLQLKQSIYEEIVRDSLHLEKTMDLFYIFDGTNCKVGINFVDHIEAEIFCNHFHTKQENRQQKRKTNGSLNIQQPLNDIVQISIPVPTSNNILTKQSISKTLRYKKKKDKRPVISTPITSSFDHIMGISREKSFFTDNAQKNLFDKIIGNMPMSSDDGSHIQKGNGDLKKLPTKSIHVCDTQGQQMSNRPPEIPPRTYSRPERNNRNQVPRQDISIPSLTRQPTSMDYPQVQNTFNTPTVSNQSTPPAIPPKPALHVSDNTHQAPPRPIPVNLQDQKQNSDIPPPPPPPPPKFLSEQIATELPTSSSNPEPNSLLEEICDFDKSSLTSITEQAPTMKISSKNKPTLEEQIIAMIETRRPRIRPDDDDDDDSESDSSDDEWCD